MLPRACGSIGENACLSRRGSRSTAPVAQKTPTTTSGEAPPVNNSLALNTAPYEPIAEFTASGTLPKISGTTLAWQYYSKPYKQSGRPHVAIILSELGMHEGDVDEALHLPQQMTFSLSPYTSHVAEIADRLRGLGYETMFDVPLQAGDYPYSDPGPYAMLINNKEEANTEALTQALSRFSGYTGGVAAAEVITGSDSHMNLLATEFTRRGIMLVYAKNKLNERFGALPFSNAWSALPAQILLDEDQDAAAIKESLKALVDLTKKQYSAIGILRAYPVSMQALAEWLPTLEAQGIELVPLSVIAKEKYHIYNIEGEGVAKPASEGHGEEAAPAEGHEAPAEHEKKEEKPAEAEGGEHH